MKYLSAYPAHLQDSIQTLLDEDRLSQWLLSRYPKTHDLNSHKQLYEFVMGLKQQYLKQSAPIAKVVYDPKVHVVKHALGTHQYISRVQGNKLKAKNEIHISTLFQQVPLPFLEMICVHELAHLKEKEHNKAFYKLCQYMMPDYHQVEFDVRVYLTLLDEQGPIYSG